MNVAAKLEADKVVPFELTPDSGCNTPDDVILEQVRINIRRGLPQAQPHDTNPANALLVCGGPSLAMPEIEQALVKAHWAGGKIIACNGAYQWCIDRNLKPSAAVVLDARESNARFIATPVEGCKYLLASQCHPKTFDLCRDRETVIWHACSAGDQEVDLLKEYYFDHTCPVPLGVTVGVRALSLLLLLGFRRFDVFGVDSCWLDNKHHAFEQPENNRDRRRAVWLRPDGRDDKAQRFLCAPWHVQQAKDLMQLIRDRGDLFHNINFHGPGLIAAIMRTGAEIQMETTS